MNGYRLRRDALRASSLTLLRAGRWHRGGNPGGGALTSFEARARHDAAAFRSPPLRHYQGAEEGQGGGRLLQAAAMIGLAIAALTVWVTLASPVAFAEGDASPHHMTKADGSLDTTACAMCHNEDFTLQRSKLETCTLCHAQTVHAGSAEHLRANPAAVKQALGEAADAPAMPLADDGHIYCGTCHLFHDPKVASEDWLTHGWLPPDRGLAAAVRTGVTDRWAALSAASPDKAAVGTFAAKGTLQMRLAVDNGQLCRRCHGEPR